MARRIMTPYFRLGQNNNYPGIDPSSGGLNFFPPDSYLYNFTYDSEASVDVRDDHSSLIRELGAAGIVLLKNENNTLPLKAPRNIGVYGNDAGDLLNGLLSTGESIGEFGYEYGVLGAGGGSGTGRFTYIVPPLDAIKQRAAQDKSLVQYVLNNTLVISQGSLPPTYPTPPDVCLVFLKTWATEGFDRTSLFPDWNGTTLVETVAASCPNTVVITHSGGKFLQVFVTSPQVRGCGSDPWSNVDDHADALSQV